MEDLPLKKRRKTGSAGEDEMEKQESTLWIDDDKCLKLVQQVEMIRTSKMTVLQFVSMFYKVRNHPIALACLADKVSKVMGDVEPQVASSFWGAHAHIAQGSGPSSTKLTTIFSNIADMEDEPLSSDAENSLTFLPEGVSVNDWCTAIEEAFGNNSSYCR